MTPEEAPLHLSDDEDSVTRHVAAEVLRGAVPYVVSDGS